MSHNCNERITFITFAFLYLCIYIYIIVDFTKIPPPLAIKIPKKIIIFKRVYTLCSVITYVCSMLYVSFMSHMFKGYLMPLKISEWDIFQRLICDALSTIYFFTFAGTIARVYNIVYTNQIVKYHTKELDIHIYV